MKIRNSNHLKIEKYGRVWPANCHDICKMLGYEDGRTPAEGMHERTLQGIKVWIVPLDAHSGARTGWGRLAKRSKHRLMAQCPECGKIMGTGRLQQHSCK